MPNTYYHNCTTRSFAAQHLVGEGKFDVAIIGGGLTGLGAGLELAQNGVKTCVLEAEEIGFVASGRNGGLVCTGFRHNQKWFEDKMGVQYAQQIWEIASSAKQSLKDITQKYQINADYKDGQVIAAHNNAMFDYLKADTENLAKTYNYDDITVIDKDECARLLGTDAYFGGTYDKGAGKINPLKLLYGLAQAMKSCGGIIYENSRVLNIDGNLIKTQNGLIRADKILICGDGYIEGISQKLDAKIMPISNFVIATEPLKNPEVLAGVHSASDTRFVVNYFHKTADNRLVFGGGEKYSDIEPKDIACFVRKNLEKVFPQLADVRIDFAWGGKVGITPTRLPYISKLADNVFASGGYSGQGVLLAPFFGLILARAIMNDAKYFEIATKLEIPDFIGGRLLRFPILSAALTYYSLLDKLP